MHQLMAATLDLGLPRSSDPRIGPGCEGVIERPLADDRAGYAQRLDRAQDRRRITDGRHASARIRFRFGHERRAHPSFSRNGCAATSPGSCSTTAGTFRSELAELAPQGTRRMGDKSRRQRGLLLRDLELPDFRGFAVEVPAPGRVMAIRPK